MSVTVPDLPGESLSLVSPPRISVVYHVRVSGRVRRVLAKEHATSVPREGWERPEGLYTVEEGWKRVQLTLTPVVW